MPRKGKKARASPQVANQVASANLPASDDSLPAQPEPLPSTPKPSTSATPTIPGLAAPGLGRNLPRKTSPSPAPAVETPGRVVEQPRPTYPLPSRRSFLSEQRPPQPPSPTVPMPALSSASGSSGRSADDNSWEGSAHYPYTPSNSMGEFGINTQIAPDHQISPEPEPEHQTLREPSTMELIEELRADVRANRERTWVLEGQMVEVKGELLEQQNVNARLERSQRLHTIWASQTQNALLPNVVSEPILELQFRMLLGDTLDRALRLAKVTFGNWKISLSSRLDGTKRTDNQRLSFGKELLQRLALPHDESLLPVLQSNDAMALLTRRAEPLILRGNELAHEMGDPSVLHDILHDMSHAIPSLLPDKREGMKVLSTYNMDFRIFAQTTAVSVFTDIDYLLPQLTLLNALKHTTIFILREGGALDPNTNSQDWLDNKIYWLLRSDSTSAPGSAHPQLPPGPIPVVVDVPTTGGLAPMSSFYNQAIHPT
ncbi:hypothetical protein BJ912DRAFT_1068516 [Pholiota molesta]|nr:hypothetical protein BJ912DRAFT_1068516 [Pholiota molesta]